MTEAQQPEGRQINVEKLVSRLQERLSEVQAQNLMQSVVIDDLIDENTELKRALAAHADAAQPGATMPPEVATQDDPNEEVAPGY